MRFWDSSALFALLVQENATARVRPLADGEMAVVWRFTEVELRSALARLLREDNMTRAAYDQSVASAENLWSRCSVVTLIEAVVQRAKRLLGMHALRGADALQLGAALTAAEDQPAGWTFVTLDRRLADAAQREGFAIAP